MGMFGELLAQPGVEEVVELRGTFGFMAFHGGSLEEMTDVVARRAAEQSGASYYGVHQPADLQWHIPSSEIDPAVSPVLTSFLDHVDHVVTVHGYGRAGLWSTLLLGGRNRELADHVGEHLRRRLPVLLPSVWQEMRNNGGTSRACRRRVRRQFCKSR